jgi:alpha-D-ribose 1-methylphosphonate 5-triphosphate synthase subunit PhnG
MPDAATETRRTHMGLLARAPAVLLGELLTACLEASGGRPGHAWLRRPETGTVMVRARTGGTGAPFNLGEMTVTRCALRLDGGEVGHAYVQGRDPVHAENAALVDALMQTERAADLRTQVLDPLAAETAEAKAKRARKAAATKVDFFTMVRGED